MLSRFEVLFINYTKMTTNSEKHKVDKIQSKYTNYNQIQFSNNEIQDLGNIKMGLGFAGRERERAKDAYLLFSSEL